MPLSMCGGVREGISPERSAGLVRILRGWNEITVERKSDEGLARSN